jgi:hypothetical protein
MTNNTNRRPITADDLNTAMDFDHVIELHDDSTISDVDGLYAPDVLIDHGDDADVTIEGEGWTALSGHTGQYGYNGAVMHVSEFIGGGLASYLLETPGVYVVVEVREEDGSLPDGDPVGWAILRRN